MRFPTSPDAPVPHVDVNADTGNFVYAISKLPPGRSYLAAGSMCSWTEYMHLWSKINRVPASYKQISVQDMVNALPDEEYAKELADMFIYSSDPGYDGGDGSLWGVDEIREVCCLLLSCSYGRTCFANLSLMYLKKAGIDCPTTSLEEWMRKQDWSPITGTKERKQSVARRT